MARREPHWVKLFIRELARTGNVRLAASGAGVDFSTAYRRRRRRAEFAERWEQSLQQLMETPLPNPSPAEGRGADPSTSYAGPPPRSGEESMVRPDGKVVKGSEARWGKRAETRFLTELTVSANVRLAAEAAGFSTTAVYQRRMKSRHFMAAWDAAVETGKARVQAYLVEAATRTFDPDELPIGDGREVPKVSIGEAINIAKLGGSSGAAKAGKGWDEDGDGHFVTNEELDAARERILSRLQRLQENIEGQEAETGCCHHCGQPLPDGGGGPESPLPRARYLLTGGPWS